MKKIAAIIVCGIIIFAWGITSWMALPWHQMAVNKFTNESEVTETIKANAPKAGIYYLPFAHEDHKAGETAAFVNALPKGYSPGMTRQFVTQLIGDIIGVSIIVYLLSQTSGLDYWGRVRFVTLTGVVIGFASHFAYWNWFGFPAPYIALIIVDSLIACFLAGLVMAKLVAVNTEKATTT